MMIKNVLLVEDNRASRDLMKEAFQAAAFEGALHVTENAEQLLQFLKKEKTFEAAPDPDLILLDLNLPGKNGIETMGDLRGDARFKDIPVVVLTGSNVSSDIQACAKYRCKYLLKPSRFHELVGLVKSLPGFC
jgi:CheY-like chemotaxis protein